TLAPIGTQTCLEFYFIGFTSLKEYRRLLFIPFFFGFCFSLTTNIALVFTIAKQKTLHSPMYVLIGSIACIDTLTPFWIVPRMIFSFATGINVFPQGLCLLQMWSVHYTCSFQSSVLFGMAVDRYFAICMPLRYNVVMSYNNCRIASLVIIICNFIIITAMVALLVVTLACGDTSKNYLAGLISFCVPTVDCFGIALSYIAIFVVIFRSAAGESRSKAIHTCSTHLMGICITYSASMTAFMAYRVQHTISPDLRIFISLLYLLLPGLCNTWIYGIRTKEIKVHMVKLLKCGRVDPL
uniref:G-protein coupled receptors family 1 profile domain-containing protein n=1 Tax=Salmo trutta TaxID=8032 RepID=A0A674E3X1_SALTR